MRLGLFALVQASFTVNQEQAPRPWLVHALARIMSAAIQPASDMSGRTSPQDFGALMQNIKGIKEGWAEIRKGMDGPGSLHWNR